MMKKKFNLITSLISGDTHWKCRAAFVPDMAIYIPFTIAVWGLLESDHAHLNTHTNFVFHVDAGRIIAAAAYPIRDNFQFIKPGVIHNMHGAIKWFQKHSYSAVNYEDSSTGITLSEEISFIIAVGLWTFICGTIILLSFIGIYRFYLKPRLIKKITKTE